MPKKSVIISCRTLANELLLALRECASDAPVYFLPEGLHNSPPKLHEYLQNLLDSLDNVERVLLCVSGCGGGTRGLAARNAELVIPKTADCLDILLSGSGCERPAGAIFLTESWMRFMQKSVIDRQTMIDKLGREEAEAALRRIYKGFTRFCIIDTGAYDTAPVAEYISPLVRLLGGTLEYLPGRFELLRKLAAGNINEDFYVIPKGRSHLA